MNRYVDQDLCEELYRLSGWVLPAQQWYGYVPPSRTSPAVIGHTPAYDLQELIDRLGLALRSLTRHSSGRWSAKVGSQYKEKPADRAWIIGGTTAANATARLAIKLFKQGKLTRED